jgi:hypothetical protein
MRVSEAPGCLQNKLTFSKDCGIRNKGSSPASRHDAQQSEPDGPFGLCPRSKHLLHSTAGLHQPSTTLFPLTYPCTNRIARPSRASLDLPLAATLVVLLAEAMLVVLVLEVVVVMEQAAAPQVVVAVRSTSPTFVSFHTLPYPAVLYVDV